jgi:hypothetical protein
VSNYIVTHQHPDLDAIGAAWLLQRYGGCEFCSIKFVNTGTPFPGDLAGAYAVVDTGKAYDPARLRFDHHQLPGQAANETCATKQVYDYLISIGAAVEHLYPLIDLIYHGDTGKPGAKQSRIVGLHALLSSHYRTYPNDSDLHHYGYMADQFDMLDQHLASIAAARRTLAEYLVYQSDDGKFVAIKDAPEGVTAAAFENGAEVVLFQSQHETPDGTSYAIGLMRNSDVTEPHVGELVQCVIDQCTAIGKESSELITWFLHPAGFFAGRGTRKAPRYDPIAVDFEHLACDFDYAWER